MSELEALQNKGWRRESFCVSLEERRMQLKYLRSIHCEGRRSLTDDADKPVLVPGQPEAGPLPL